MFGFFKKKNLAVPATKKIKVHGVPFVIKKLDVLAYLDGSKAMLQEYATYAQVKESQVSLDKGEGTLKKMKTHFTDVFCSSIVEPRITRKKEEASTEVGGPLFVENLFTEWDLAIELYEKILDFTYGKKKSIFGL